MAGVFRLNFLTVQKMTEFSLSQQIGLFCYSLRGKDDLTQNRLSADRSVSLRKNL